MNYNLEELKGFIHDLRGLSEIEEFLRNNLNLKDVIVVPGNTDESELILEEMGKSATNYLKEILKDKVIIALTGGVSIKKVVDNRTKIADYKDVLIVPARGGLGRNVDIQANTLAARLAEKLSADYKMLQLIDNVDYAEIFAILNEESIKEVVDSVHKANILIYGIGKAEEMAVQRYNLNNILITDEGVAKEIINIIKKENNTTDCCGP